MSTLRLGREGTEIKQVEVLHLLSRQINELIDRIKVLEADRDRLHSWIMKDSWGWRDIDGMMEHESLASTIMDEVTNNIRIDGPVSGLSLEG
jgi:hypothetical protein